MDRLNLKENGLFPFIPLRELVLFPGFSIRTLVGREKSLRALDIAFKTERIIFLATQKDQFKSDPGPDDIYPQGVIAQVERLEELPNQGKRVTFHGRMRAQMIQFVSQDKTYFARVKLMPETEVPVTRSSKIFAQVEKFLEKFASVPISSIELDQLTTLNELTDFAAFSSSLPISRKIILLGEVNCRRRARFLVELEEAAFDQRTEEQSSAAEDEPFEINSPQNESDPLNNLIRTYKQKIRAVQLPEVVLKRAREEQEKLFYSHPNEVSLICNYLDWLLKYPWKKESDDNFDLKEVKAVLEKNHFGLKEVKERILEYLAVKKLSGRNQGEVICFSGPPGVGKSSLARSIAEALNKKFVRISLGGVSDEAEIRGHRRTYLGAYPGRIVKGMVQAGFSNPLFLLDEIDKLGSDLRGDPASALLEVLDPETNHAFLDRYLDLEVDLSRVFFIATANGVHNLLPALRDRLDVIELPEYTEDEKLEIARRFLIPRSLKKNGLEKVKVTISLPLLKELIHSYTREAGVRNLERIFDKLHRRISWLIVGDQISSDDVFVIRKEFIEEVLGAPYYFDLKLDQRRENGLAVGLAWTQAGGEILIVEARLIPGKGELILTGSLGDVMKESSTAAWSWVRGQLFELGFDLEELKNFDLHLHFPEGATPKDGPSAGITIATAMLSEIISRPARKDLAMSGEITIQGRVLPIGGIKAKVLAAYRYGIRNVVFPLENRSEFLKEVSEEVRLEMKVQFVDDMAEVIRIAFPENINMEKIVQDFRRRFIRQTL